LVKYGYTREARFVVLERHLEANNILRWLSFYNTINLTNFWIEDTNHMTEETKTNPVLEQFKTLFNNCSNKLRRMDSPREELQTICETLREAVKTDRMGSEPDFAEFVNKELSIGLMQKLAKTISFDHEVSA